jgi:hypothetical protein
MPSPFRRDEKAETPLQCKRNTHGQDVLYAESLLVRERELSARVIGYVSRKLGGAIGACKIF